MYTATFPFKSNYLYLLQCFVFAYNLCLPDKGMFEIAWRLVQLNVFVNIEIYAVTIHKALMNA